MLQAALILVADPLAYLYFFSGPACCCCNFCISIWSVLTEFFSRPFSGGELPHMKQNIPPESIAAEDRQEPETAAGRRGAEQER
jgi:hypothetical protein